MPDYEKPCILILYVCNYTFAIKHFKSLGVRVSRAELGLTWQRNVDFQNEYFRKCDSFVLLNSVDNQISCP